mmetsp:Transcript_32705/g.63811  ORF Transcript_32705/g.63811 Transcript_32705/m.63811 type:complete len:284 (-) Transcript_32705:348-1199(-)
MRFGDSDAARFCREGGAARFCGEGDTARFRGDGTLSRAGGTVVLPSGIFRGELGKDSPSVGLKPARAKIPFFEGEGGGGMWLMVGLVGGGGGGDALWFLLLFFFKRPFLRPVAWMVARRCLGSRGGGGGTEAECRRNVRLGMEGGGSLLAVVSDWAMAFDTRRGGMGGFCLTGGGAVLACTDDKGAEEAGGSGGWTESYETDNGLLRRAGGGGMSLDPKRADALDAHPKRTLDFALFAGRAGGGGILGLGRGVVSELADFRLLVFRRADRHSVGLVSWDVFRW